MPRHSLGVVAHMHARGILQYIKCWFAVCQT